MRKGARYSPQVWPEGGLKTEASEAEQATGRLWSCVKTIPEVGPARPLAHLVQPPPGDEDRLDLLHQGREDGGDHKNAEY